MLENSCPSNMAPHLWLMFPAAQEGMMQNALRAQEPSSSLTGRSLRNECTALQREADPACCWHLQQAVFTNAFGALHMTCVFARTPVEAVARSLHPQHMHISSAPKQAV